MQSFLSGLERGGRGCHGYRASGAHVGDGIAAMGDEWVRLIYSDEAAFMEDHWATVEAALPLLPGVDWKPNYSKRWPKRSAALAFEQAVIFHKGEPSQLSGIEVHLRSSDRLVIFRIRPRDMHVTVRLDKSRSEIGVGYWR